MPNTHGLISMSTFTGSKSLSENRKPTAEKVNLGNFPPDFR